jgi:hypothetical protein
VKPNQNGPGFFPSVEGSMTSSDGKLFLLHVKRESASDLMPGFPHAQISNIVENAAMQAERGKEETGRNVGSAFNASSFKLGREPDGEAIWHECVARFGSISYAKSVNDFYRNRIWGRVKKLQHIDFIILIFLARVLLYQITTLDAKP